MEQTETFYTEIVKQLTGKYREIEEIYRNTKDMKEALDRNDRVSAQMILEMRQEAMSRADQYEKHIRCLLENLPAKEEEQARGWLHGQSPDGDCDESCKMIYRMSESIRTILKRTIEIDKTISRRLAGRESYYQ